MGVNYYFRLIFQAWFSGVLIGIGVVANAFSDNKYVGAFLFSFALLSIIRCQLPLFTGKIGYFLHGEKTIDLTLILVFNLLGSILSHVFLADTINTKAIEKFNKTAPQIFMAAVMCGCLIYIAVYTKETAVIVLCIMVFIISGFEHCIADFPFLIAADINIENLWKFIMIILGNSIGAIVADGFINTR